MADLGSEVKFLSGTQNTFDGLGSKDSNTFYYCTDTRRLYLGDQRINADTDIVPAVSATDNNSIMMVVDGKWQKIPLYTATDLTTYRPRGIAIVANLSEVGSIPEGCLCAVLE